MRRSHFSYLSRLTDLTNSGKKTPSFSVWSKGVDLELFMCPMEALIMDYFWENYPFSTTIGSIHRFLKNDGHFRAYTTVATVTRRLVEKSILRIDRTLDRRIYYVPTMRRDDFIRSAISSIMDSIECNYGDIMRQVMESRNGSHIRTR